MDVPLSLDVHTIEELLFQKLFNQCKNPFYYLYGDSRSKSVFLQKLFPFTKFNLIWKNLKKKNSIILYFLKALSEMPFTENFAALFPMTKLELFGTKNCSQIPSHWRIWIYVCGFRFPYALELFFIQSNYVQSSTPNYVLGICRIYRKETFWGKICFLLECDKTNINTRKIVWKKIARVLK